MSVQSDHDDLRPFVRKFNAVVISYLDGALPLMRPRTNSPPSYAPNTSAQEPMRRRSSSAMT